MTANSDSRQRPKEIVRIWLTHQCKSPSLHCSNTTLSPCDRPLSSAVIVPDPVEESLPSPTSTKRRQSPFPEADAKRARLSENVTINGYGSRSPPLEENQRPGTGQKRKDQAEERKRGQRLFGALLGTLSQSSSSTAPKRRRDIEEKQTAKLRHEADEFDEKRKQRLEVLTSVRRRQQKVYDRQGVGWTV